MVLLKVMMAEVTILPCLLQGLRKHTYCAVRQQGGCEEPPSEAQAGHLPQVSLSL